uniref:ADAMTS cysteine-rich domain-containing protein n=1 Tax=Anopheles culicifacies TaxID=139723 RepID=A0A182M574_9DIPT
MTDWSVCSATCGGGKQYREPICYHMGKRVTKQELCLRHAYGKRLEPIVRDCNDDPCPFNWWVGPWQLCPITCRNTLRPVPIRRRSILCVDSNSNARSDAHCNNKPRPHDNEPCGEELPLCQDSARQETERPDTVPLLEDSSLPDLPSPSTPADYEVNNSI